MHDHDGYLWKEVRVAEAQKESESSTGSDVKFAMEILLHAWYLPKMEWFRFNYSGWIIIVNIHIRW